MVMFGRGRRSVWTLLLGAYVVGSLETLPQDSGIQVGTGVPISENKADGYRGIWFTLGQFSEYGDKYSGGLGTYTANHVPLAIHVEKVDKTFFVYGGTMRDKQHLLIMASYYDH